MVSFSSLSTSPTPYVPLLPRALLSVWWPSPARPAGSSWELPEQHRARRPGGLAAAGCGSCFTRASRHEHLLPSVGSKPVQPQPGDGLQISKNRAYRWAQLIAGLARWRSATHPEQSRQAPARSSKAALKRPMGGLPTKPQTPFPLHGTAPEPRLPQKPLLTHAWCSPGLGGTTAIGLEMKYGPCAWGTGEDNRNRASSGTQGAPLPLNSTEKSITNSPVRFKLKSRCTRQRSLPINSSLQV